MENITIPFEAAQKLAEFVQSVNAGMIEKSNAKPNANYVSPFAAWLLSKADMPVSLRNGTVLSKSEIDETTLDFTSSRTLSEEDAEATVRFIWDKSPYLRLFNNRTVNKLVTPVQGRAITKENLVSNEQNGGAVTTVNRRIVHNFGVNLYLKNFHMQKDIPLQTVIDNLYNPSFYAETMNDVAIALANDILLLAINGLEATSYASSENFYDLNRGFVRILQLADGKNTNTYGSVQVTGWMGKVLTPQKLDASGYIGTNYNAANLLSLMRKMYKAMPQEYRNDPANVWMMARVDADTYMDSRSDMGFASGSVNGSNTTREMALTTGNVPNFMGHSIVVIPDMYGINETHKYSSSYPGALIFGNPKNIDVAVSSTDIVRSTTYEPRGTYGATYEYDFQGYMDIQVSKPESFVIAFNGAKLSAPILVSEDGSKTGMSGEISFSSPTYTVTGAATTKFYVYCDNPNAKIVKSLTDITGASYDTYTELNNYVISDADTEYIASGGYFTLASSDHVYLRACSISDETVASIGIDCNITIS